MATVLTGMLSSKPKGYITFTFIYYIISISMSTPWVQLMSEHSASQVIPYAPVVFESGVQRPVVLSNLPIGTLQNPGVESKLIQERQQGGGGRGARGPVLIVLLEQ